MTLLTPRWTPLHYHPVQIAYRDSPHRFIVVPAGRRSGKTERAKRKLVKNALVGSDFDNARFFAAAPTIAQAKRIYWQDLKRLIPPSEMDGKPSETELIIRTSVGSEIHVLGMDKPERMEGSPWDGGVLDEYGNMKAGAWGENVRPALADRNGWCDLIGVPEGRNHYYDVYQKAVAEMALRGSASEWGAFTWLSSSVLDAKEIEAAKRDLPPKVFQQEYEGAFVDFSGEEFFDIQKLLVDGLPVDDPVTCDAVFVVIDCAMKDGKEHDGVGAVYYAASEHAGHRLTILDWELNQIQGADLEDWLPSVFRKLEAFTRKIKCRFGSLGAYVEDASAGSVLIQQSVKRGWAAGPIDSDLTAMGKDSRAFSISGYVHQELIKISRRAWEKTSFFKEKEQNHLVRQVADFRVGDPLAAKRADDLFDCFCYGPIIALGNADGY